MKKSTLFIAIAILLFSCENNSSKTEFKKSKADTTTVIALYVDQNLSIQNNIAYRVVKDTFAFVPSDDETMVKQWTKDSLYFIKYADTARGPNGIMYDTLGRPTITFSWKGWDRRLILIDGGSTEPGLKKYELIKPLLGK